MVFTSTAFCNTLAFLLTVVLIFFTIWSMMAFDDLKTDCKNARDQSKKEMASHCSTFAKKTS
uniref:Uncharacterized protein n=1 Tax=Monodelphis domestica TaxID=13616 RepID=A0A5F8G8Y3_MONDO